jgi:hypothetical protein
MCIYHIDGGESWWRGVVDVGLPRKYPWIIDLVLGKRGVLVVSSANKQHRGHDLPSFRLLEGNPM